MKELERDVRAALFLDVALPEAVRVPGATLYPFDNAKYGPDTPYVCVIGAFDGLHMGHRALIDAARAEADERDLPLALVTFVPDPSEVLSKRNPRHLCTDDDRILSLGLAEPDLIIAFDFTWSFSRNSYETFTLDVLGAIVRPVSIHVGADFTFGADGAGSPADIARLGEKRGFMARGHKLIEFDGVPVSSTRIRGLIEEGRVDEAKVLLGRHHMMRAAAFPVDGRTVLAFDNRSCMPASGAYSCFIATLSQARPAAVLIDAPTHSAVLIPEIALPEGESSCSVVFLAPIRESDDSFSKMWVEQSIIQFSDEGVGA